MHRQQASTPVCFSKHFVAANTLLQSGFSLVELVVSIAVLVSVSLIAMPAFQSSIGNAQVRTVAESIRDGLQQARVEAIKRNSKIKFTLATDSSWSLGCVTVTTLCPSVIAAKNAVEGASSQLSITANAYAVTFSGFGTRDVSSATALSQVDVTNPTVNLADRKALRVVLVAGGYVRVCDPAVTKTGDPRQC